MSYTYLRGRPKPEHKPIAASPGNEDVPVTYQDFHTLVHGTASARRHNEDEKANS